MSEVKLSIVIPCYNEAPVLKELVERLSRAVGRTGLAFEIILVDDFSSDNSAEIIEELGRDFPVRLKRLDKNLGQFGATKDGLRIVSGEMVAVLDADLQDPPETISELIEKYRSSPGLDAVLAVKSKRKDPLWFRLGRAVYVVLQKLFAPVPFALGSGSYCIMSNTMAARIAAVNATRGNLAAYLAALRPRVETIEYEKRERYDGRSRSGFLRFSKEALVSLAITGALSRIMCFLSIMALVLGASGFILSADRLVIWGGCLIAAGILFTGAIRIRIWRRRNLESARQVTNTQ